MLIIDHFYTFIKHISYEFLKLLCGYNKPNRILIKSSSEDSITTSDYDFSVIDSDSEPECEIDSKRSYSSSSSDEVVPFEIQPELSSPSYCYSPSQQKSKQTNNETEVSTESCNNPTCNTIDNLILCGEHIVCIINEDENETSHQLYHKDMNFLDEEEQFELDNTISSFTNKTNPIRRSMAIREKENIYSEKTKSTKTV
jgi:hypothetical protein